MHLARRKNSAYIQNQHIIKHLAGIVENNNFNRFVTVSFVYSRFGTPLNKSEVLMVSRLMAAYFNKVSAKLKGRPRKNDNQAKPKIPAIGFPEYRSKTNGSGFIHYHALMNIPEHQLEFFDKVTKDFWKKIVKNTIGYAPRIDNRAAYNPKGAAFYSNKFLEDGFTLENTVYCGISLT